MILIFSFVINNLDTAFYILKLELSDNNFNTWVCYYPVLVYWDNSQYVSLRVSNPMTANFSEYSIFKSTKLLKIVDVYGREVTNATNQVLFYIYDNGYVEKKMLSR